SAEQFTDPRCARVAAALLGNNNDDCGSVESLVADPTLAEDVSRLLVVDETGIDEPEFEGCLERIERHDLKRRAERLKGEIGTGSLKKGEQRYEEYLHLVRILHGQRLREEG